MGLDSIAPAPAARLFTALPGLAALVTFIIWTSGFSDEPWAMGAASLLLPMPGKASATSAFRFIISRILFSIEAI